MFAVNTRGPFLIAKAAHGALKASQGRIINLGSLGGLEPWATHGHYCASKAALHMLSQTMAKAWAPEISVNTVAPGMIQIDAADASYASLALKTPMKRNGTADDVAAAVLFFATAPHFITGQLLAVDGGLGTLKLNAGEDFHFATGVLTEGMELDGIFANVAERHGLWCELEVRKAEHPAPPGASLFRWRSPVDQLRAATSRDDEGGGVTCELDMLQIVIVPGDEEVNVVVAQQLVPTRDQNGVVAVNAIGIQRMVADNS